MSNVNQPMGLSPVRYLNGAPWNDAGNLYYIASDDGNAYAIGDPMTLTGTADGSGVPGVTLATAGTGSPVTGALVSAGGIVNGGFYGNPNSLSTTIIPATKSQAYYVLVADDPNILFEIQESATSATPLAATDVGSNANLVSGTNNGYVSGWLMNNNTLAVTSTLQLKIVRLVPRRDNAFGAYAKWLVLINNHTFRVGSTGV